ncbi:hypothetical protein J2Z83_002773 [Virgibacillus natechei]|uniref:Uncharacterized protein n=1 Tax=Virgibacillus natechei TaxID=1216297 RepID=A0ABS4II71_9BACI|nr:hypothetical protein [Virgibacillus natechei]
MNWMVGNKEVLQALATFGIDAEKPSGTIFL